jgi:hypothetical protein
MHCTIQLRPYFAYAGRSRGEEDGNSSGASPRDVGGPQASSGEDANIVVIKASPYAFNYAPCL